MKSSAGKKVLISGASFAGLATAFWMKEMGCAVTVVEIARALKKGGTPVNIRDSTVDIVKRMGLFDKIESNRLKMEVTGENVFDEMIAQLDKGGSESAQAGDYDYEIERDVLLNLMFDLVKDDVEFLFGDSVSSFVETDNSVDVTFSNGKKHSFDLLFGCDGVHSDIRKQWFGAEENFSQFIKAYGSVTIVDKLLIPENTVQMHSESGKMVVLSAYNNKTDIILMFSSDEELRYDHRDDAQKRNILINQFSGVGWRIQELLEELKQSRNFYFDKLCQIKMPSWTKGRVALVGDAGYCASPAAGMGGSLAIVGAAALGDAFEKCDSDYELAFEVYNKSLRPFAEEVQSNAVHFCTEILVQDTERAVG